jgi:signal transduction histidine kinase
VHNDVPLAVKELTRPPALPDTARRLDLSEPPWALYYAVIFAVCVAIAETGPLSLTGRIVVTAALAAMVPWYLLVGYPMMRLDDAAWQEAASGLRGLVYLSGLIVLFGAALSQNTNVWFLAWALTPQCFHVTSMRRGMVFVVILNATAGVLVGVEHPDLENVLFALGIVVFAIMFSYVFSRFTVEVVEQNVERAALIDQLSSTRHELAAVNHEAGVLAERHRLAGEIHDTLAQGFTSIVTLVQAAQAGLGPDAGEPGRHLDMALATARENLAEARALITVLSPARLDSGTLGDALRRVAESTGAEARIQVSAEVAGTVRPLPTGTEVVLLRVCQEALANARRHAAASAVLVRLCYGDDMIRLEVTDDGAGFDTAAVNGGYGLRGMRDRVQQVGGTVQVRSEPGVGTKVRAEVPG